MKIGALIFAATSVTLWGCIKRVSPSTDPAESSASEAIDGESSFVDESAAIPNCLAGQQLRPSRIELIWHYETTNSIRINFRMSDLENTLFESGSVFIQFQRNHDIIGEETFSNPHFYEIDPVAEEGVEAGIAGKLTFVSEIQDDTPGSVTIGYSKKDGQELSPTQIILNYAGGITFARLYIDQNEPSAIAIIRQNREDYLPLISAIDYICTN